jgi:hypothetical protein
MYTDSEILSGVVDCFRTYAKKPGFYGKFIILTNGIYEETGFLGSSCVSPMFN